jgi:uncharacterized protein YjbJ (UPF0337 family)
LQALWRRGSSFGATSNLRTSEGTATGDAKLAAKDRTNKAVCKLQNAVAGLKDALPREVRPLHRG